MAEFTYEVTERIAVLSTNARRLGAPAEHGQLERQPAEVRHPRLSPDGSRMAKGISLTEEELKTLKGILDDMEL